MTIFIIIWSIWCISEIVLNNLLQSNQTDKKDQDKGSFKIIWITVAIANTLGILSAKFLKIPISNSISIPYLGLLIIVLGMIIRFFAIYSLGRLFTVDVTIRNNHKIKKDGLYKLIRHPAYSGSILSFIGFGLSLNNVLSLIIISVLIIIAMLYRIKVEESLLSKQFGIEYQEYMKRTYRLIPWVY